MACFLLKSEMKSEISVLLLRFFCYSILRAQTSKTGSNKSNIKKYFIPFTTGSPTPAHHRTDDVTLIRPADLENHNKEGGLWVVIHGKVYDLSEFKDQVSIIIDRAKWTIEERGQGKWEVHSCLWSLC